MSQNERAQEVCEQQICRDSKQCKKTSIGGQALIEGIMMRGPRRTMMAVRHLDGHIVTEEIHQKPADSRPKILRLPIIRGVIGYIDSMIFGYKALMRSADLSGFAETEEESKKKEPVSQELPQADELPAEPKAQEETKEEAKKENNALLSVIMVIGTVLGVALALFLFLWLPAWIFDLVKGLVSADITRFKGLFENVLKILILVGYMAAVSLMKDIRRTFMYHGAEHKTIACYEAGLELTVENCRTQRRFHPRCGTSFLILMLLVSILTSTLLILCFPSLAHHRLLWVAIKLLLIPLVCGLGYELIKFCGRHDNLFTRIISAPGMWLQRLTTKEPTDDMLEIAICAMTAVIPENKEEDQW
ncbi:MAG: DUF1385 domain-containing protein [Clostridia bacterium]|nr:DUF1385 domain-containing protein [Clostridia bacterium]